MNEELKAQLKAQMKVNENLMEESTSREWKGQPFIYFYGKYMGLHDAYHLLKSLDAKECPGHKPG